MPKFVRVRDTETGHKFSTALVEDHHEVLDEPATGADGKPLRHEPAAKKALEDMTVPELQATIDKRNVGRGEGDQIPRTGNKGELLAALQADTNKES